MKKSWNSEQIILVFVLVMISFYIGYRVAEDSVCNEMEIILEEGSIQNKIEEQFGKNNLKEFLSVCNV